MRSPVCAKARILAALAPDGQLSVRDADALRAHVAECADCSALAAGAAAVAERLRSHPLEPVPSSIGLSPGR